MGLRSVARGLPRLSLPCPARSKNPARASTRPWRAVWRLSLPPLLAAGDGTASRRLPLCPRPRAGGVVTGLRLRPRGGPPRQPSRHREEGHVGEVAVLPGEPAARAASTPSATTRHRIFVARVLRGGARVEED